MRYQIGERVSIHQESQKLRAGPVVSWTGIVVGEIKPKKVQNAFMEDIVTEHRILVSWPNGQVWSELRESLVLK